MPLKFYICPFKCLNTFIFHFEGLLHTGFSRILCNSNLDKLHKSNINQKKKKKIPNLVFPAVHGSFRFFHFRHFFFHLILMSCLNIFKFRDNFDFLTCSNSFTKQTVLYLMNEKFLSHFF